MKKLLFCLGFLFFVSDFRTQAHQIGESLFESVVRPVINRVNKPLLVAKAEPVKQPKIITMSQEDAFYNSLKPIQPNHFAKFTCESSADSKETSLVTIINGDAAFYQGVIEQSKQKLVVVKICAGNNQASLKIKPVFQQIATKVKNASFVAMDLFEPHKNNNENYQLVMKLMVFAGFNRFSVPTFMFFKQGKIIAITPMSQQLTTGSGLLSVIKRYL